MHISSNDTVISIPEAYKRVFHLWVNTTNTDAEILTLADSSYQVLDIETLLSVLLTLTKDWFLFRQDRLKAIYIKVEPNISIDSATILYLLKVINKNKAKLTQYVDKKLLLDNVLLAKNWLFEEYL